MKPYAEYPITGWHVLVTILAAILIASLLANFGFIQIVDTQQYQIEKLEYRLYELNLKEIRECYGKVMNDPACYDPIYRALYPCPQVKSCNTKFTENEQYYKDW
jgi:hypothetical protein